MKYYYTAKDARQRLGIDENSFAYLVEIGKLKKIIPFGKKKGLYSRPLIERLAKEKLGLVGDDLRDDIIFRKATLSDIEEEYELSVLLLNSGTRYDVRTHEALYWKNPDTDFIVKDQGRLVSFINVLPVKPGTMARWLKGNVRGWEIDPQDVLPYLPGHAVECIVMGIATIPDVEARQRHHYGMYVLRGFLRFLCDMVERGITISKLYAIGTTPEGIALLKRAKFAEKGQLGKHFVFELDLINSDMQIAKVYRALLKARDQGQSSQPHPMAYDDYRTLARRERAIHKSLFTEDESRLTAFR